MQAWLLGPRLICQWYCHPSEDWDPDDALASPHVTLHSSYCWLNCRGDFEQAYCFHWLEKRRWALVEGLPFQGLSESSSFPAAGDGLCHVGHGRRESGLWSAYQK